MILLMVKPVLIDGGGVNGAARVRTLASQFSSAICGLSVFFLAAKQQHLIAIIHTTTNFLLKRRYMKTNKERR